MAKKTTTTKKRVVKVEAQGQAHISSTFNNVIVSLCNAQGQVISWSSAGKCGFRGSKKNTPYAAQMAAEDASKTAFDAGLRKVKCYVKGPGEHIKQKYMQRNSHCKQTGNWQKDSYNQGGKERLTWGQVGKEVKQSDQNSQPQERTQKRRGITWSQRASLETEQLEPCNGKPSTGD